jgi:hypothetical protein
MNMGILMQTLHGWFGSEAQSKVLRKRRQANRRRRLLRNLCSRYKLDDSTTGADTVNNIGFAYETS